MANMYDPTLKDQASVSGSLYYRVVFLLLLISGMYHFLIAAIVDSYTIIPITQVTINMKLYDSVIEVVADYFIVGMRIALPVFVTLMILNVILGVLTKVASQINMFSVGIQIKLLVGLGIMFLTVGMLPSVSTFIYNMMEKVVKNVAGGMV